MNVVEVIEDIVNQLQGPPVFVQGRKAYANLAADDLDYTNGAVFLYTPLQSNGMINETYKVLMFFGTKHELNDPDSTIRPLIDSMKSLSQQFLLRLEKYEDTDFRTFAREIKNVTRTETENEYDVNLCGIILQFDLLPFPYDSQCII